MAAPDPHVLAVIDEDGDGVLRRHCVNVCQHVIDHFMGGGACAGIRGRAGASKLEQAINLGNEVNPLILESQPTSQAGVEPAGSFAGNL